MPPLHRLAEHFWTNIAPKLQARLARPDKLVVLGTAPAHDETSGTLRNRALILADGKRLTQDKLFLTPWETSFIPGDTLRSFEFKGLRIAVVICLDIEMPELSVLLRGRGVDLILVPSATETLMGCERVTRCASARSVELGCAVIVSPLVGRCTSELVDENLGKLGGYLPSQGTFAAEHRMLESTVYLAGFHKQRFSFARHLLTTARQTPTETNPSLIRSEAVQTLRIENI